MSSASVVRWKRATGIAVGNDRVVAVTVAWMPAAANVPAQLLVAVRRTIDGEPRVVLQGIVPPR